MSGREQNRFAYLQDPGMTIGGVTVAVSLLGPLIQRLAVFMQLLSASIGFSPSGISAPRFSWPASPGLPNLTSPSPGD